MAHTHTHSFKVDHRHVVSLCVLKGKCRCDVAHTVTGRLSTSLLGFVVDEMALGLIFRSPSVFLCHYHFTSASYLLIYRRQAGHWAH